MEGQVKSVVVDDKGVDVFVGLVDGSMEHLKRCPLCAIYHQFDATICPKTGKSIAEEQRQLEKLQARTKMAEEARREYQDKHLLGWKNKWRGLMGMLGSMLIFFAIVAIVIFVLDNGKQSAPVGLAIFLSWFFFWVWRDMRYKEAVYKQADNLYQRVLEGEEVAG